MNQNSGRSNSSPYWLVALVLAGVAGPSNLHAQASLEEHCAAAKEFLVVGREMMAVINVDTIQDWRTGQRVPGCRVTAAGTRTMDLEWEARHFYEQLMTVGWVRTPDPRDAPNEASLRFRMGHSDCLFNFYSAGHLGTPADLEVSSAVIPGPGESRYNVFVICMPAMDAARRTGGYD